MGDASEQNGGNAPVPPPSPASQPGESSFPPANPPALRRRRPSREAAVLARLDARAWNGWCGPFRALDVTFSVRATNAEVASHLERVLASLRTDEPARTLYSVVAHGDGADDAASVYFGGQRVVRALDERTAIGFLLWHLNRLVVAESSRYLLVHASAAAVDRNAIVFPAAADSGKTTLVAGLLMRGFRYLTDETVAIDPGTGLVQPYPKPLTIDARSWAALRELGPMPDDEPPAVAQAHVAAGALRSDTHIGPCRPRLVITPRYEPDAPAVLEPLTRAQGLVVLAENAFNFAARRETALEELAAVVRGCRCFRLTYGSLAQACDTIADLVSEIEVEA